MNLRELKETIESLLAQFDDIDGALKLLDGYLSDRDVTLHHEVVLLSARLSKINSDLRRGFIEKIDDAELAKIRFSIMQILEEIPNEISIGGLENTIYLTARPFIDMENIIGRDADIESLAKTISEANKAVLLNGWGGIGKTTVAKGYLNTYEQQFKYILWIEVTGVFFVDFLSQIDYKKIGFQPNAGLSPEENFKALVAKLDTLEGGKLIVIDNFNQADELSSSYKYFPQYGKVLITTMASIPHFIEYKLESLKPEYAKILFYKFYSKESDDENLIALLKMVGFHTLTIELLARTIDAMIGLNIEKMLQIFTQKKLSATEFKKIKISILKDKEILESQMYYYILSLFNMSNLSLAEEWVMAQFAVLPTVGIDGAELIDLLQISDGSENAEPQLKADIPALNTRNVTIDTFSFSNAINSLVQKGWLEKKDSCYQIHPLIQEVTREKINPDFGMCINLATSLCLKLKEAQHNFTEPIVLFEAPLNKYITYSKELSYYLGKQMNITLGELNNALAFLLSEMYQLQDALFFQLKSLVFYTNYVGAEQHETLLNVYDQLSVIYRELGDYEAAKNYQLKSIELREPRAEMSLKQAIACRQMAITCKLCGALQLGLSYVNRGFKIIDAILPEDHIERAASYNDATAIFLDLGMWDKSLEVLNIAKAIREKYQPESNLLSDTYNNLASVYLAKKELEKALEYQKMAVSVMEKVAQEEHPVLAHKYSKLSIIYRALGETQQALDYQQKALKIRLNVFGKTHPYCGHSYNFIALIYFDLKDFDAALLNIDQALAIREKNQHEFSTELAESNYNRAIILHAINRNEEAIKAVEKSIEIYTYNKHPSLENALALKQKITST